MKKREVKITVEEFLKNFPPGIKDLTERLRIILKKTISLNIEAVYPGWKLIGYRVIDEKKSHYFAFIHPTEEMVVLGFEYGYLMNDSAGIFKGGELKQVRYIEFKNKGDIKPQILRKYISEAALIAVNREAIW